MGTNTHTLTHRHSQGRRICCFGVKDRPQRRLLSAPTIRKGINSFRCQLSLKADPYYDKLQRYGKHFERQISYEFSDGRGSFFKAQATVSSVVVCKETHRPEEEKELPAEKETISLAPFSVVTFQLPLDNFVLHRLSIAILPVEGPSGVQQQPSRKHVRNVACTTSRRHQFRS